ncbi:tetratricopeptide repeat protein [Paracoccus actinidiae]|uniref:tetratricopeptide repeat protein n=1 Tax=Paracoccus actinidiae TaxID=3064531 RepID=UPI0027D2D886|nr:tetratricopeptide repeat protein [Paracoccus sp. M09]
MTRYIFNVPSRAVGCAVFVLIILLICMPAAGQAQDEVERLTALAERYGAEGKWNYAIAADEQALTIITSRNAGTDNARLADIYDRLGRHHAKLGDPRRSEACYRMALNIRRQLHPINLDTAITLNNLAGILKDRALFSEAENLYEESLSIRRRSGDQISIATVLNNIGLLYLAQLRFTEAESKFVESLEIRVQISGPTSSEVATARNNLALLYHETGRFAVAEEYYKESAAIREQRLGQDHPLLATTLGGLAVLYRVQGRHDEAEPLFERSLSILRDRLPPNHPDIATTCNNFANLMVDQARYDQAETLYHCALTIRENLNNSPALATTLINYAGLLSRKGAYSESEALLKRALMLVQRDFGPDSLRVSVIMNSLGGLALEQSRLSEARLLFERALVIRRGALAPDHPDVIQSLTNLGGLNYVYRDWGKAVGFLRQASHAATMRYRIGGNPVGGALVEREQDDLSLRGRLFGLFAQSASRLADMHRTNASSLEQEAFEAAQWAQQSAAATSLAQASARFSQGVSELARVLRERQDLVREWQSKDTYLVRSLSRDVRNRDLSVEQQFRSRMVQIDARVAELDDQLRTAFPEYAALAQPKPLGVDQVQALLGPSEALVAMLTTETFRSVVGETIIWVVTRETSQWARVPLGTSALTERVQALRCGLDSQEWEGISRPARCGRLLGMRARPLLSVQRVLPRSIPRVTIVMVRSFLTNMHQHLSRCAPRGAGHPIKLCRTGARSLA